MFYHKDVNQFFLEHGNKYPALGNNDGFVNERLLRNPIAQIAGGHKKCYPGVCVWNGMLRFENIETFYSIVTQLEEEIELYDASNVIESDDDESYDRDYPTLDAFEASLGFTSLRQRIEARENLMKDENLELTDRGFEDDEMITTFLNSRGEYRIGNSIYVFRGKTTVLEIVDADMRTLNILRNRIYINNTQFQNVILHDLEKFETSAYLMPSGTGNETIIYNSPSAPVLQTPLNSPLQAPKHPVNGSNWPCRIISVSANQTIALPRHAVLTATVTNMPWAIPPNYPYPGPTYLQWDIYEISQSGSMTKIHSYTTTMFPPCDGCTFEATYSWDFPKEGGYRVEVTAWNEYCRTEKVWINFYISDLSGCCKWYDFSGKSKIYSSTRALRAELTIRNYPGFARLKAKTTVHKVVNGSIKFKKKKADKIAVSMGGRHYWFACKGEPVDFEKPSLSDKTKNNARRISVRKFNLIPMTVKRLPGNACPELTSVHRVWDGSHNETLKLWLPLCGYPETCSPGN